MACMGLGTVSGAPILLFPPGSMLEIVGDRDQAHLTPGCSERPQNFCPLQLCLCSDPGTAQLAKDVQVFTA